MSATAFQRARREAAALKAAADAAKEKDIEIHDEVCLECMTNEGLKALCNERGIEYKSKATKAELIALLQK